MPMPEPIPLTLLDQAQLTCTILQLGQGGDEGVKPRGHKLVKGKSRGFFHKKGEWYAGKRSTASYSLNFTDKFIPREGKTLAQGVTAVDPSQELQLLKSSPYTTR